MEAWQAELKKKKSRVQEIINSIKEQRQLRQDLLETLVKPGVEGEPGLLAQTIAVLEHLNKRLNKSGQMRSTYKHFLILLRLVIVLLNCRILECQEMNF